MSRQQSFTTEIPVDIIAELHEFDAISSQGEAVSDLPDLNVVNAAIEVARIAEEAYQASRAEFRAVLRGQGYEMEQLGSYEDTTYHMVHRSVEVESLGYWGAPDDGTNPLLVIAM